MHQKIKTRREESANYSSVFFNGKTLRIPIDRSKPITELKYPEFYDISLGNKCETGKCPWCFPSGTMVSTLNGISPIENINIGETVITFNFQNLSMEPNVVEEKHVREYNGYLIEIETESSVIRTTPTHKFFTKNRGWVEAQYLTEQDDLFEIM